MVAEFNGRLPASVASPPHLSRHRRGHRGGGGGLCLQPTGGFIETNIRRVFLHFFFPGQTGVKDRDILPLVDQTLDRERPRPWYYALMDYGARLPRAAPNPNRRSAHYQRQTPFANSDRQIRGLILKTILKSAAVSVEELVQAVGQSPERTVGLIPVLIQEGFLDMAGRPAAPRV